MKLIFWKQCQRHLQRKKERKTVIFNKPVHQTINVTYYVKEKFEKHQIGFEGATECPLPLRTPRSIDLTPLDFYLLGSFEMYI